MPDSPIPAANVLAALIMGGFLGLLGQGTRTIVGLKGLYDEADSRDVGVQDLFSAARLLISLLIGFLAGLAATLAIGIDKLLFVDPSKIDVLLGIAAAGYVGTDFLEGFMSRFAPARRPSAPAEKEVKQGIVQAAYEVSGAQGPKPQLQCGSVRQGSTKPDDLTIKSLVLRAADRSDLDPKTTDDETPMKQLVGGAGGDYLWIFAQHCQFDFEPFRSDQLSLDARYVTAHGSTLGDFVSCIKCCYKHPRVRSSHE